MDSLRAAYRVEEDEEAIIHDSISSITTSKPATFVTEHQTGTDLAREEADATHNGGTDELQDVSLSPSESLSESDPTTSDETEKLFVQSPNIEDFDDDYDDLYPEPREKKKKKRSAAKSQAALIDADGLSNGTETVMSIIRAKKKKKLKNCSVWVPKSMRRGKKKTKFTLQKTPAGDMMLIGAPPSFSDKFDDSPDSNICLSKVYKADKVELSEDRLSAGSTKGYRMVRATRGVSEGAWYFEIKVVHLGETGHTRLGWSTDVGDLQAPVGYDEFGYGYRDIDGNKVHKAWREKYGEEGYKEGDVIGFYINLPDGGLYTTNPHNLLRYSGHRYICAFDPKNPPKIVPGSVISFFKNGVCQGVAFTDMHAGRYHPAASMYTLPNQPNCVVKFNFGPDFEFYPNDFGDHPVPKPMIEVPYQELDAHVQNGMPNDTKS